MRQVYQGNYMEQVIFCDTDTSITLPNPLVGGGPLQLGVQFQVIDNLLTAGAHTITITGPIASTSATATATITANGGSQTFVWTGTSYSLAIQ